MMRNLLVVAKDKPVFAYLYCAALLRVRLYLDGLTDDEKADKFDLDNPKTVARENLMRGLMAFNEATILKENSEVDLCNELLKLLHAFSGTSRRLKFQDLTRMVEGDMRATSRCCGIFKTNPLTPDEREFSTGVKGTRAQYQGKLATLVTGDLRAAIPSGERAHLVVPQQRHPVPKNFCTMAEALLQPFARSSSRDEGFIAWSSTASQAPGSGNPQREHYVVIDPKIVDAVAAAENNVDPRHAAMPGQR